MNENWIGFLRQAWPIILVLVLIIVNDVWNYYHPDNTDYSDPPEGYES